MKLKHALGAWILIVGLGLFFGHQRITSFPKHVHAWAEGGQYAIALGFIDNGFDFFEPETFVLNPQFPGENGITTETGITSVDFPIFQYAAASVMKISGVSNPFVYRLIVFLYSCLGLFLLFKLTYLLTQSLARSLVILLFVLSSPVFVYYQTGMLISMPALSTAFIAIYFLIKYYKDDNYSSFLWAVVFISLAAAIRTTYLILLGAIGLAFIVEAFKKKKFILRILLPLFIGLCFVLGYRYYNFFLANQYGSIFLNQFLMAENFAEFQDFLKMTWSAWKLDYFSKVHYVILFFLAFTGLIIYSRRRDKTTPVQRTLFFIASAAFLADLVFLVAMIQQFPQHDYYFLDTFFIPLVLFLIVGISLFPRFREKKLKYVFVLAVFIPAILHAMDIQTKRTDNRYWNEVNSTVNSLKNADSLLDCLGFDLDAKVLILGAHGGNLPLVQTRRKGYTVLRTSKEAIVQALKWDFDILLLPQDLFLTKVYPIYPEFTHQFKRVGGNGQLGVFVKNKDSHQDVESFLGLKESITIRKVYNGFEDKTDTAWTNTARSFSTYYNGKYAAFISEKEEFGLNYNFYNLNLKNQPHSIYINAKANLEKENSIELVVVAQRGHVLLHYESKSLNTIIRNLNTWIDLELLYELPPMGEGDFQLSLYVWNNGRNGLYLDDLEIQLFENKKDCN